MTAPKEDPEATRIAQEWGDALEKMSEDDERLITLLRLMGGVDPRYEMKGIRVLVGRALVDPEFRSRVLEDTDAVVAELRGHTDLPDDVRIRCVENSADYLTIVLPPPSEPLREESKTIRDLIFSRTSADRTVLSVAGVDDNDVLPVIGDFISVDHDHFSFGDPSRDG